MTVGRPYLTPAAALLFLAGCSGPIIDDQAKYQAQLASCPEQDRFKLRVGMSEETMLRCSFPGYTPYVKAQTSRGRLYGGSTVEVIVVDGKVADWVGP